MIRLLPFVVEFALLVFCLIDCIQTAETEIRNLPKWAWIVLILVIPLVGGVAWLVAGRPLRPAAPPRSYGAGPPHPGHTQQVRRDSEEIDKRLEADLARVDAEYEEMLRRWQADQQHREEEPRPGDGDEPPEPPAPASSG